MSYWLMALHLLNFLAPAVGLALVLGVWEAFFIKKMPLALAAYSGVAMYFSVSLALLVIGLTVLGRDGKVLTYAAVVLVNGALVTWRHR